MAMRDSRYTEDEFGELKARRAPVESQNRKTAQSDPLWLRLLLWICIAAVLALIVLKGVPKLSDRQAPIKLQAPK